MELIIDVFRNRPAKSVGSIIVITISIVTLIMFQTLKVENLSEFINFIFDNKNESSLLLTWGFNLITFTLLVSMGIMWIKDIVKDNYMDTNPEFGRLISGIIGVLHLAYSFLFLKYIFSDLLGVVVAVLIIIVIIGTSKR